MQVPRNQRKRQRISGSSVNGYIRHRPEHKDHFWSYDFLSDRTEDGRQLRVLAVIDEYTRENPALEVGRSFTAQGVVDVLRYLFAVRCRPRFIRSDNGPEFVADAVRKWLNQAEIGPLYIAKGSPWENGYVESFNARFRDELLNRELFLSVTEVQWVIDRWRNEYNHHRPHSALDYQTPAAYGASCADSVHSISTGNHTKTLSLRVVQETGYSQLGIHKFNLGYKNEGGIMLVIGLFTIGTVSRIIGLNEGTVHLSKDDEQFHREYVESQKPWF